MTKSKFIISALVLLGLTVSAFGGAHKASEKLSPFHKSFLQQYEGETGKLVDLAKAFSEDGYAWRPAEGIRSVRESILHVAGANYFIGSKLGKAMPEGINPREFDKTITTKAGTIKVLEDSIAFAKSAVKGVSEEALNEELKMFGQDYTKMGVVLLVGGHAYEHLGQLIAYARSSDVVPPWSN
jgi:uncharacterized damage-inducible protein DinB